MVHAGSIVVIFETSVAMSAVVPVVTSESLSGIIAPSNIIMGQSIPVYKSLVGNKPENIESASDLAADPERRIKFQSDVQRYIDHAISSTINLPAWGTDLNNEDKVEQYAKMITKYAPGLRGLTMYPDGSRGGQPITPVPYEEASSKRGVIFEDNTEAQCLTGVCGI